LLHVRRQTGKRGATEGWVRIGGALAIPVVLRSLGADPNEVLAEAGFDPELFDDPDSLVSYAARGLLLDHCVTRTGCRHFGLLVGQQGGLHSLGLVGLLVKYSPDVETALRSLVSFFHLHVHGAVISIEVHGNVAVLNYGIYESRVKATDQIGDGAVAVMFNIMRALCGPDWKPIEARFAHRKPEDVRPFRQFFCAPVRFFAEENAVVFSADWLTRPLPGTDPELHRVLQKQVDALAARHSADFAEQVRSVLRTALLTSHAKADEVAALFSIHSRTMHRRLKAFDTSFQELVDESRFEIARQMLEASAEDVSEIAASLNYADASAFTRAFRRWSGTTPAAWRARSDRTVRGSPRLPKRGKRPK
jgi:AraC-like DNA-binding protein